ncbi:MAG: DNA polymerase, partial [Halothece sp.]
MTATTANEVQNLTFHAPIRAGFMAEEGRVKASIDYSSQEMMIAAVFSGDPTLLGAFQQPKEVTEIDGSVYKNPFADIHALNAVYCTHPHLFENVPEKEWVAIAKDESLTNHKGDARSKAKNLGYGTIYDQTPQGMSDLYNVPLETAKEWHRRHRETYPKFHEWKEWNAHIGETRGWIENPYGR